jgi:hypothetical protein
MTSFVLMLTEPDNLIQNVEHWTVCIQTLIRVIFRVSLKQSKLWKAGYTPYIDPTWKVATHFLN